jgi:hypothetical protein
LVSYKTDRTQTQDVREYGAEEDIRALERAGSIKLHNVEFHDLYSSPNIIRVIISRRTRWVGNMARMGDK